MLALSAAVRKLHKKVNPRDSYVESKAEAHVRISKV